MAVVMIDASSYLEAEFFDSITHDQISLFQAHLHIRKEFIELSSGFLEGFCLRIIFWH